MPVYVYNGFGEAEREKWLASMLAGLSEAEEGIPRGRAVGGIAFPADLLINDDDTGPILVHKTKKRVAYLEMRKKEVFNKLEQHEAARSFLGVTFLKNEPVDTDNPTTVALRNKKMAVVPVVMTKAQKATFLKKCAGLASVGVLTLVDQKNEKNAKK